MLQLFRKFGLERCDLPTMMWNVSILLRALALNIDSNSSGIPAIFYLLIVVAAGSYYYIYLVSMIWFVFWRCMETGNVLAALIVFSLGIASETGPVKLFYMMFHTTKIKNIVRTCLASDALVVPGGQFSRNLLNTLRKVKKRAMVFWVIMMSNGIIYIIRPFLMPGRHLMDDQFMYYGLEPMLESPNYEMAITITVIAVLFTCYSSASITAFVIVSAGYVEAQMLSWSEELRHLWEDAKNHYSNTRIQSNEIDVLVDRIDDVTDETRNIALNKFVEIRLKHIIKSHARNLNLLQQIESLLRGAVALEFSILIIGLIAELLGGLENTYMEVPFSFIQVAMDCLTGQKLTDASVAFERAVFSCKWENFDRSNMKLVLLMLQISQKTMTLSAGGMAMLNFACLMSVVRSIYSAYTTLRSTMV